MNALAGLAACAALAAFAVGCDHQDRHETSLVDTPALTGADLAARDAAAPALTDPAIAPLRAPAADLPIVRATPANGAYVAPQAQVSPPASTSASPTDTFVGSSFGPAPTRPGYVVPASPPSDNHGNGTLGSSTGSHEFDNGGNP